MTDAQNSAVEAVARFDDATVEAMAKAHCDFFGGEGWWDTGLIADTKPKALEAMRAALASLPAAREGEAVALDTLRDAFMTSQSNGHPDPSERSYRLIFSFSNLGALQAAHTAMVHAFRKGAQCSTGASGASAIGGAVTATTDPAPSDQEKLSASLESALRIEAWNYMRSLGKPQDDALAYVESVISRARQTTPAVSGEG
ncbi:hypothetical protein [Novosphingobium sp. BL-52-GroH]|uniref:hypothetical protein n=1 Tax=Novosphingobium sp. BL-52-GroH TaxID=3349877 RepID=UPI00384D6285